MSKLKRYSLLVCAVATLAPLPVAGQILPPGASVERLATGYSFTEGPVYDGNGHLYFTNLFFSNVPSQILRYDVATGTTEVIDGNSGKANGLFFDQNGQIVSMDMGGDRRQVSRRAADDISIVEEVLASEWNGIQFNSTNDLVIAQDGGIYFTDPDYLGRQAQPDAVYYLNPGGELSQIISGFPRPNGIILSPDGQTLYLAVSNESRIMAYDVDADGLPKNGREFARTNGSPDGMTVDPAGNVYAAVEKAVSAWDATGQPLFDLSIPERASNVTFGGVDGNTLFITAKSSLYGIEFLAIGDVNHDSEVNGLDVDPFVDVLLASRFDVAADMNGDGVVDGLDVDPFVAAVVGGGVQQVPEPSTFLLCLIALGVVGGRRKWSD